jgi:hypothetical protein
VSFCLGFEAQEPWSLWVEGSRGVGRFAMSVGEAVLYRGMECPSQRCEALIRRRMIPPTFRGQRRRAVLLSRGVLRTYQDGIARNAP